MKTDGEQGKIKRKLGFYLGALLLLYVVLRPFLGSTGAYMQSALADATDAADATSSTENSQTIYLPQPVQTIGIGGADDESVDSDQIVVYVVRKGETLSEIATMYGVTEYTIRKANDLSAKEVIREGMHLTILPVSLEEEPAPAPKPTKKPAKPSSKLANYDSYYTDPLPGHRVTQKVHGHNGVDMAVAAGSPIHAAAAGTVLISKNNGAYNGGYGNYVVLAHDNGTQTLYGHLSKSKVSVGDRVSQNQIIGLEGNTGKSTGSHLHFEVRGARNPF